MIGRKEVYRAIKKLKRKKALGPYEMKTKEWKEGWEFLIQAMHKCINDASMKRKVPEKC